MSSSHKSARRRVGSVRQLANGKWEVRVSRGYRMDGKQRVARDVCDTEEQASARAYELAIRLGRDAGLASGRKLADVWGLYVTDMGDRLAGTTMDTYTWNMGAVVLPALGDMDVDEITHSDIQDMLYGCTRSVAGKARTALSSVLTWAVRRGMLTENVMRRASFELPDPPAVEGFDTDPFAAIEGSRDVWGVQDVLRCFDLIRGLPLESAWLACVGGGLRVEEALALRKVDVRKTQIQGREVVQVAVHAATTRAEARRSTKTRQSVRIVAIMEPFGSRFWELVQAVEAPTGRVCDVSAANQNKRWRSYFDSPPEWHKRMADSRKVRGCLHGLPYLPLSRMRATHETMMQEAGVLDSLNAAAHGHTEQVSRRHYMRGDSTIATQQTEEYLTLVS